MSEYGDEGLDKEENEGKPNLKQKKEENDDNYLKDDWEPSNDKFEKNNLEDKWEPNDEENHFETNLDDKWEPVDLSMENMRKNDSQMKEHKAEKIGEENANIVKDVKYRSYSTLELIEDLHKEVAKLVPHELYRGKLAYWKLCKYLGLVYGKRSDGKYWNKIEYIKKTIKKNPNYEVTLEILDKIKENLGDNFKKKAHRCYELIEKFKVANPSLKEYSNQQWHLFNPNLNVHYFDTINSIEKAYWLGFLSSNGSLQAGKFNPTPADLAIGKSVRYRYSLSIEISEKDKIILREFCNTLKIDHNKIKKRVRKKFGKKYPHVYIRFDCKPIAKALKELNFSSSKAARRNVPKFSNVIGGPSANQLFLGFLRGYYDGDGWSGSTTIGAANKQFLVHIKHRLKINFPVRKVKGSNTYLDEKGKIHILKSFYALSLGAKTYDKMTKTLEDKGLFYLKRKTRRR